MTAGTVLASFVFASAVGIGIAAQDETISPQDEKPGDNTVYRWVFGGDGDLDQARKRLDELLENNIALLVRVCELSNDQKLKLQLVGRGENKRLLEQIAEIDKRYQPVREIPSKIHPLQDEAWKINQSLQPGLANADLRLFKALEKTLTKDQRGKVEPLIAVIRAGGRVRGPLDQSTEGLDFLLYNTQFNDDGMALFKGMTDLLTLNISGTRVTDAGLENLREIAGLRMLQLSGLKITDAGLAHLSRLTDLYVLDLSNTAISDKGLSHIKDVPRLQWLLLNKTQTSDKGLSHLTGLKLLRHLALSDTQITDAGLIHLKDVKTLEVLELANTRISDKGLEHLSELTGLNRLSLNGTQVTDAGLSNLLGLSKLQYIWLGKTKLSPEGILKFRQALPTVNIQN